MKYNIIGYYYINIIARPTYMQSYHNCDFQLLLLVINIRIFRAPIVRFAIWMHGSETLSIETHTNIIDYYLNNLFYNDISLFDNQLDPNKTACDLAAENFIFAEKVNAWHSCG